jgi:hypothetical protein
MDELQKEELLKAIHCEFERIIGDELDQIILYGSYA